MSWLVSTVVVFIVQQTDALTLRPDVIGPVVVLVAALVMLRADALLAVNLKRALLAGMSRFRQPGRR
jgi:hypothetical protein